MTTGACSSRSPASKTDAEGSGGADSSGGSDGSGGTATGGGSGEGGEGGVASGGNNSGACPSGFSGEDCQQCEADRFGDSCESCACVNGTCDDGRTGSGECACNENWVGESCTECRPGWAGTDCDQCAGGYHQSGTDCIVDEPTACQADSPSADHHVDLVFGFDDPHYGGGAGACAFRTVQYALAQATGRVLLAGGTHAVETTLSLVDGQELVCDATDPGVLNGQPPYLTWNVAVRMVPNTALRNCIVRGEGQAGYCIETAGAATIENAQIENCGGAAVRASGSGLSVVGSEFLSSGVSVFFQASGSAEISDNVFHGGPSNVNCNASSTITGSGNSRPAATVTCSALCNCPVNFGL